MGVFTRCAFGYCTVQVLVTLFGYHQSMVNLSTLYKLKKILKLQTHKLGCTTSVSTWRDLALYNELIHSMRAERTLTFQRYWIAPGTVIPTKQTLHTL